MMARPTVVIVVDDNAGLLKIVARLLAHHGIDSRTLSCPGLQSRFLPRHMIKDVIQGKIE